MELEVGFSINSNGLEFGWGEFAAKKCNETVRLLVIPMHLFAVRLYVIREESEALSLTEGYCYLIFESGGNRSFWRYEKAPK